MPDCLLFSVTLQPFQIMLPDVSGNGKLFCLPTCLLCLIPVAISWSNYLTLLIPWLDLKPWVLITASGPCRKPLSIYVIGSVSVYSSVYLANDNVSSGFGFCELIIVWILDSVWVGFWSSWIQIIKILDKDYRTVYSDLFLASLQNCLSVSHP